MLEVGQILEGKYEIVRLIGQGGMGAVYEGLHTRIERRVAIKTLLRAGDQTVIARFEMEARAAGRIGNDHILEVLDFGEMEGGGRYMVTEFLDGEPLSDRILSKGRLSPTEIVPMAVQLLNGLGAAHEAGVVHRDLKPDNVFLVRKKAGHTDFVKIIDFGISKFSSMDAEDARMTQTGIIMGTPYFMSPEQARGAEAVDLRADIYAVGVILYNVVSGRVPFLADTLNELLFKLVLEEPPSLLDLVPGLDQDFVQVVARAMARDRQARYQSAAELSLALTSWAAPLGAYGDPTSSRTGPLEAAHRAVRVAPTDSAERSPQRFARTVDLTGTSTSTSTVAPPLSWPNSSDRGSPSHAPLSITPASFVGTAPSETARKARTSSSGWRWALRLLLLVAAFGAGALALRAKSAEPPLAAGLPVAREVTPALTTISTDAARTNAGAPAEQAEAKRVSPAAAAPTRLPPVSSAPPASSRKAPPTAPKQSVRAAPTETAEAPLPKPATNKTPVNFGY